MRLSYYGTRGYVVECTHSHYLLPFWQDEMLEYIITIIILLVTKLESCWVPFNDLDLNNASNILPQNAFFSRMYNCYMRYQRRKKNEMIR